MSHHVTILLAHWQSLVAKSIVFFPDGQGSIVAILKEVGK